MAKQLIHSVRLYFPFTFDSNAEPNDYQQFVTQTKNLRVTDLLEKADFLNQETHQKLTDASLWLASNYKIDKRIHPFGHKLVNGLNSSRNCDGFFGLQPQKLNPDAIRVLNGGTPNSLGNGITVSVRPSATKRLSAMGILSPFDEPLTEQGDGKDPTLSNQWPLRFNDIWFYGFSMGLGMMVVDVSFAQPGKKGLSIKHIESLQEINYVICRNSADHQAAVLNWSNNTAQSSTTSKGLSGLVEALMPPNVGNSVKLAKTSDWDNTYSYTYVAAEQPLDIQQRKDACFRLARKYNDRYLPEQTESQIEYFHPFKSMTHSFSLEGASSYVDLATYNGDVPEAIKNFHTSAIPQAYSVLILLTYAEYLFLRDMATNTADEDRVDMGNPTEQNLDRLRDFRTKLYDFRLNFRYTQISGNTNHNLFANHNKAALEIDGLLQETSSDAQEVEQFIADHVSQQQEARLKKFGILGSLFAVIIGWVDLWGLNLHSIFFENAKINPTSIAAFLVVLALLSSAVIFTSRTPKTNKSKKSKVNKNRKINADKTSKKDASN